MKILKHFLAYFIFSFFTVSCSTQDSKTNELSAEQWVQDINYYLNEMPKVHLNPYHSTSKEEFEKFVTELSHKIHVMTDNEIIAQINKMTGMINDGHTSMNIFDMHHGDDGNSHKKLFEFHYLPIRFYVFTDGIFVINASDEYKELIGKKITKIGGQPIDEVYAKISAVVPKDNKYSMKSVTPIYMIVAELLNGFGVIKNDAEAEITAVDANGREILVNVKTQPKEKSFMHIFRPLVTDNSPLYLQNYEKKYWFKYIEDTKTLYINYKLVLLEEDESMTQFCNRMEEFIAAKEIEKTIVDIRNNGGGNLNTCFPLVNLITQNEKINKKGKLFVIIGRQTFSAASFFTTKLEFNTQAIFAGEPTGATPNHYGDPGKIVLPNSGLEIRLSSKFWQNSFPFDDRIATEPQIKIEISSKDYFSGKDPVFDAVMKYNYKPENKSVKYNKNILGSYLYSPIQILDVTEENGLLRMSAIQNDFYGKRVSSKKSLAGKNITYISTAMYPESEKKFKTDINGLVISFKDSALVFEYNGVQWQINKITNSFKTPVQLLDDGNYAGLIDMLKIAKRADKYEGFTEEIINELGYYALNRKNYDGAIEIFKLNTEFYPESFNTWDSLGEAYMEAGNRELAIENYKKSLELNSNNQNGKRMLDKLMK